VLVLTGGGCCDDSSEEAARPGEDTTHLFCSSTNLACLAFLAFCAGSPSKPLACWNSRLVFYCNHISISRLLASVFQAVVDCKDGCWLTEALKQRDQPAPSCFSMTHPLDLIDREPFNRPN
jgi:hypothetical protein